MAIRKISKGLSLLIVCGAVILISFAIYLGILYRQPLILPAPTGPYKIGRTAYDWIDQDRVDALSEAANQKRELLVWIWYPADPAGHGATAPYLPGSWIEAENRDQGISRFLERDFSSIQTHAFANALLAKTQAVYPVIIMQPGMGPVIADYTSLAENLASYGYIVVGVNETYTSNILVFPDGRVMPRSIKGSIPEDADAAAADREANRIEKVWAGDVVFVMNELQHMDADPSSRFYNKLDLAHLGVFGHSFGGATAARICETDPRCRAGADLDGTIFSEDMDRSLPKPFLFMAEDDCGKDCATMHQLYLSATDEAYYLSIEGTRHFDFSDLPLRLSPPARILFRGLGMIGSIPPQRGLEISNAYLVAFFDHYLKDIDSELLRAPSSIYPEVRFEKHS